MAATLFAKNINRLRTPIAWCLLWVLLWGVVFRDTLASVYTVWMNSNTYTHCIFVVPIALYFAYQRRSLVLSLSPKPSYFALIPMLALQGLWLVGFAADIEVFKHASIFGMLSTSVVMFFGWRIAKVLWFPLIFIVFAIPIGEELVPLFQLITADLTVFFLQMSGIAVYRDGLFITIPEGMFEVAEACSGIRFFVACVVMGAIIAYTNYRSVWKRVAFFVFSAMLPIVANGLRAYGTILVAHLVDIKYAHGADHLVYGWGFFAFVVLLLVLFSRLGAQVTHEEPSGGTIAINPRWVNARWYPVAMLAIAPMLISGFLADSAVSNTQQLSIDTLSQPGKTVYVNGKADWCPVFSSPTFEHLGVSTNGVDYYIGGYNANKPGAELISEQNRLFDIEKWRYNGDQMITLPQHGQKTPIRATLLEIGASNGIKRLVLFWYYLPNISSSNSLHIKLSQAFNILLQRGAAGTVIALSVPIETDLEPAKHKLRSFAENHAKQLESMVLFN